MMEFDDIGVIRSPHTQKTGMPIQPSGAAGVRGTVEVDPEFAEGLADLDGFSHIHLIYRFHESNGFKLTVTPFLDDKPHGLFSTRAPRRPNPIGLSVVKLIAIRGNVLEVEGVDVLDGTPLLDIKPYVPEFDGHPEAKVGWMEQAKGVSRGKHSDSRFRDD